MLGVKPAIGRVFNSQEDDQGLLRGIRSSSSATPTGSIVSRAIPMLSASRSRQRLPDDDRRRLGGRLRRPRSRAFAPDPRPRADEAGDDAGLDVASNRRIAASRWVQVFGRLKPGQTIENSSRAGAGALTSRSATYEATLPAASKWSVVNDRDKIPEGQGRLVVTSAALGFLAGAMTFRPRSWCHVHGRPCPSDRVRERRQPPDRPRVHAPERNRGAVCRSVPRVDVWSGSSSPKACCSRGSAARSVSRSSLLPRRERCSPLVPSGGQPLLISPHPDPRILAFTSASPS